MVKELTLKDFEIDNPQKLASKYSTKVTIIKFYLPECGWCKKSQPEYVKLDSLAGKDFNVLQVNCEQVPIADAINSSNIFGFAINGYPTYAIYVNGLYKKLYEGDRSAFSILNELVLAHSANNL
jgi:thiol-disulfide isomerase/thioredoxin